MAEEENKDQKEKSEYIKITVASQDTNDMNFRIKKANPLSKLMKSYSERVGLPLASLRFLFDGRRIEGGDTPTTLEMEDEDVIEVYKEQTGGGLFSFIRY